MWMNIIKRSKNLNTIHLRKQFEYLVDHITPDCQVLSSIVILISRSGKTHLIIRDTILIVTQIIREHNKILSEMGEAVRIIINTHNNFTIIRIKKNKIE